MLVKALRRLSHVWAGSGKKGLPRRPQPRPFLELLEGRLLLSGGAGQIGRVLPLCPPGASPYGVAQPDLPTAEATGLYSLILGRAPDASGLQAWTSLLQGGASPGDVARGFLASPEYQASLVQGHYQNFLNRAAEPAGLSFWAGALAGGLGMTGLAVSLTTSSEYQGLYPTNTAFVQSLYANALGREGAAWEVESWNRALAGGASRAEVTAGFVTSTESLTQSVQGFYQVFFQRAADTGGLASWVDLARRVPLSVVLGGMLSSQEFQFRAAAGTAARPSSDFFGLNQQALVPDPATDPVAPGAGASAGLVPMGSPWDQALVFPSVPYDSTVTGSAAQPTLRLPTDLVASLNLAQGGTIQFWFQAKGPGVLLSATIPDTGETATGTYPAPLIYLNASGKLVAGLFDQTALSVVPYQNPLSWKGPNGQTQVGAAHPLVSQIGVLDNTWHHAALVYSSQSQALYVDGLLQGTSRPQYHQTSTNLTSIGTTLVLPLDLAPSPGQMVSGTIAQVTGDSAFGPGGTSEIYRFEGWLPSSGQAALNLTATSGSSAVTSVTYSPASGNAPATLTFTLSGPISSANALTVAASYLTPDSAYSFGPAPTSTWSTPVHTPSGPSTKATFGALTGLTVGGTIFTEPTSKLYPATNYPKGFVGAVDEVALWDTMLTQPQVQSAMSGPVLPLGPGRGLLTANLVGYFPFTRTAPGETNEWPNEAPGASSVATGPTAGTRLAPASSTIPTDPFPAAARLPGARAWGLSIMTPLASPSLSLTSGMTFRYKVGLAAGDQLKIEVPEAQDGSLTVVVEDDLGRTSQATQLAPDATQYLAAGRTGTYQLTLTWTSAGAPRDGVVNFGLLPGPLNSVMGLFASYAEGVSPTQTDTVQAYSDPFLPGINPTVGTDNATGAADYWPLWSDAAYFSRTVAHTADDLNLAYQKLVSALIALKVGLSDFANINGAAVTSPTRIQQFLDQAYVNAYGVAPPAPPGGGSFPQTAPFPVKPAATPQDAVYEFFYNANLLRQTIYSVLTGEGSLSPSNLQSWVQGVINSIDASAVPVTIATTIATGQAQQVHNIPVNVFQPSQKQSVGEILLGGLIWAAGGVLAAIPGLDVFDAAIPIILAGAGLAGGGAALGQSFVDNAYASGAGTTSFTVPVTSITNSELNYEHLNDMAVSIQAGAQQLWNNVYSALTADALAQSVLSNYGLLKAFSAMSGAPLGDAHFQPADAVTISLARSSWQQMIPATFQWAPVAPHAFPTGTGQTNDWAPSGPYPLGGGEGPDLNGVTSADFNKDGKLDLAVANFSTSNVSILLGAGGGTFNTATTVGLNGPDGALGITSGDFNGDGNPDLMVSDYSSDALSLLLGNGNGTFQTAKTVSLSPPNEEGPDGPWGVVSGDFNKDGKLDVAVADYSSAAVSILLGHGDGTFTAQTLNLPFPGAPTSIATADFDNDGHLDLAVANQELHPTPYDYLSVLLGNGDGTFRFAPSPDTDLIFGPPGIVVGDLNGDHFADIAVTNNSQNSIDVLLGKGDGTFHSPNNYPLAIGNQGTTGIALAPTVGGFPNLVVTCTFSNTVNVFFNRGNGTFLPAISVPIPGSEPTGIVVADFAGDGLGQAAIVNNKSSDVVVLSPYGVGNTATFLPGTSGSSDPLSGPTDLKGTVDPTALDKLLSQMAALQGGNTAFLGPFDERSLVSPQGTTPPNFMAFTSLVYPDNRVPLSLNAPGMFLSLTPATLNETADNGTSYTQNGAYLAGWQLLDSNGNPIAPETLLQLFGTPSIDQSGRPVGAELTPVNPSQPFAAFNGGWYFDAEPVNGAAVAWADAFFGWGLGTKGYSPGNLTPSAPLIGSLPNTATPNVTGSDIAYKLSFQPATDGPPAIQVGVPVNLGASFNRVGIVNDGAVFSSGGIDGDGFALSGTLLGASVIANGTRFIPGAPNSNNVVIGAGQVIPLPASRFSNLNLLGTAVGGPQSTLNFTVAYADGTTDAFTQGVTNWATPSNAPGETTAATMLYRNSQDGSSDATPVKLSAYHFALDKDKTVKSITLTNGDNDVALVAITLT